jgi:hypothetical protein
MDSGRDPDKNEELIRDLISEQFQSPIGSKMSHLASLGQTPKKFVQHRGALQNTSPSPCHNARPNFASHSTIFPLSAAT